MIPYDNSISLPVLLKQGERLKVLQRPRQNEDGTDGNSRGRSDKWSHPVSIMKVELVRLLMD